MTYGDLYEFLAVRLFRHKCNHTLAGVRDFLDLQNLDTEDREDVILDLQENGGYCDCEVLMNVMQKVGPERQL